ncbi:hypothetical protein POVCU2_0010250 [Plasmodium ovale curtisi]|uniref:Uncharacterized protein n=1 Tax=Plasmodium ovale curtisi TaxID=864141 RepID=A0A1A8VWX3_PLAOA|nr:hypothetical protein POVCU2_0010250 [Plasmodium ovale curtisi]SBS83848.1 hypothetical protein POVCU1_009420 [Plasmodium ovale curtisi]
MRKCWLLRGTAFLPALNPKSCAIWKEEKCEVPLFYSTAIYRQKKLKVNADEEKKRKKKGKIKKNENTGRNEKKKIQKEMKKRKYRKK